MRNKVCRYCSSPLMKIDHYGDVLIGCVSRAITGVVPATSDSPWKCSKTILKR